MTPSPKFIPSGSGSGLSDNVQVLNTPPGIPVDENSQALARRLDLSAVAMEKLQLFAKSFGLLRPNDEISLPGADLVTLETTRKFLDMIRAEGPGGSRKVPVDAIPSGNAPTGYQLAESKCDERKHVEDFMSATGHLTPDERIKLLIDMSGAFNEDINVDPDVENDRNTMITLSDRLKELHMNLELQFYELTDVHRQLLDVMKRTGMFHEEKVEFASEFAKWTSSVEDQLELMIEVDRDLKKNSQCL